MPMKKYPAHVYRGITSDPDTWGMCCSEEMARKCAEEYYDTSKKEKKERISSAIISFIVILLAFVIFAAGAAIKEHFAKIHMPESVINISEPKLTSGGETNNES